MDHNQSIWQTPPQRLRIATAEAHVWLVPIDRVESDTDLLSTTEQERATRLHHRRARLQYTATQCTLRRLLGRYLDAPPQSVYLMRTSAGKPYVGPRHGIDVRFNVSHSGDWAMIAFALGQEVGVDLEAHRPLNALALAQRFFCDTEARRLTKLEAAARQDQFFQLWTAKEALVKAMGSGIAGTLKRFDIVTIPRPQWRDLRGEIGPDAWSLHPLPAPLDYSATLAVERDIQSLQLFRAV